MEFLFQPNCIETKVKLENPPIVSIKENPLGTIIPHLIPLPWRYTIVAFFFPILSHYDLLFFILSLFISCASRTIVMALKVMVLGCLICQVYFALSCSIPVCLLWSGDLTILVYEYNYNQLHHHGGTTKLCTSRPLLFLIQHTYRPKSKVE